MSIKKDQLFTLTAALGIIRDAVERVVPCDNTNSKTIIFNSLMSAIEKKHSAKGV